jgi:hypothetical protein
MSLYTDEGHRLAHDSSTFLYMGEDHRSAHDSACSILALPAQLSVARHRLHSASGNFSAMGWKMKTP